MRGAGELGGGYDRATPNIEARGRGVRGLIYSGLFSWFAIVSVI